MRRRKIYAIAASVVLFCLFAGCEPADWDVVINEPEAVKNFEIVEILPNDDEMVFTLTYTVPELAVFDLFPDQQLYAVFYYRKKGEPEKEAVFISKGVEIRSEDEGKTVEYDLTIEKENLKNGEEYIITAYVLDIEGQLSEGSDSEPVTVSW
jgi:hypothetical protein